MFGRLLRIAFYTGLVVLALCLLSACRGDRDESGFSAPERGREAAPPVVHPPEEIVATQKAFIDVYARVMPAVVNISATRMRSPDTLGPLFEHFFGDLFKRRPMPKQETKSLGSGFIVDSAGYILTNEHVIKEAEAIEVRLADGRTLDATVVGVDPETDVAVIKVESEQGLPVAVLGNSDQLRVGQWALAIGNPFGLEGTLTVGVISATERANLGIEDYEDFIQTDASINPGNSGGPLLNIHGEVIGINTAIVAAGQGIGFAIPINLAKLISEQLIEKGEVTRGWLGVGIQPLTPGLAETFGLDRVTGALVNRVLPDSPAARAGLRRGDILLEIDGKEIRGVRELQLMVASAGVGESIAVTILRDGARKELVVKIAARDEESVSVAREQPDSRQGALGLRVGPNPDGEGVSVLAIDPDSAASRSGIRPGDVILSINRVDIDGVPAFLAEAAKIRSGANVVLLIQRGEATMFLAFQAS